MRTNLIRLPVFCLTLAFTEPAMARDGLIQINAARAVAGGVTPTDTPGYPVTIDTSDSYLLTGDLVVASENTTVVEITADRVTLDLNGFGIYGPVACFASPPTCFPGGGTGHGIHIQSNEVTIRNGSVKGNGADGISGSTASQIRIESVDTGNNGRSCVNLGTVAVIRNTRAVRCALHGFEVLNSALLVDNIAVFNGGVGIASSSSSEAKSGYRSNIFEFNSTGTVSGNPVEVGPNICNGDTTCP